VPLRELVRVREAVGPVEIQRLDQSRVVPVYADAVGRDESTAPSRGEAAGRDAAAAGLRSRSAARTRRCAAASGARRSPSLLALLLVYMILAAEFESLVHPFTCCSACRSASSAPSSRSGCSAPAQHGVAHRHGHPGRHRGQRRRGQDRLHQPAAARGHATREAIFEAGRARLRPIVMNTITTMLGITPMMLGIGPAPSLQAPLAIAVFGGLFTPPRSRSW
jgi:hydrophobic/amphiphilic exporter-1 (mainly G- bacteria), HAE1 family